MNRLSYVAQNLILHVKDWKNEEVSKKLLFKDMKSARNFLDALLVTLEAELSTPSEQRFDTDKAEIYWIDDFLTDAECDALIPTIKSKTAQGGITNKANTDPGFRTAQVHDFEGIPWIQQKIADHMGIHTNFAEPLQGQVYAVGQLFKEHADYFDAYSQMWVRNHCVTITFSPSITGNDWCLVSVLFDPSMYKLFQTSAMPFFGLIRMSI